MATIRDFYCDRSVFLTGASGFLGKQVLEKLLRSTEVQHVYALVRPKKGKTSQERKELLLQSQLFSQHKLADSNFASRVVLVPGEMTSPDMGLSEEDMDTLKKNVSVVIHCAASVNFHEKIRDAMSINVIALQEMVKFSKTLPRLESFVHVSTAYVHCYDKYTPESIVKPNHHPKTIVDLVQKETDEELAKMTPKLIHPWPNTYTFTKCLGEWILHEEAADDFPACIFRPSIIGASAEEPFRGWVDNLNAATGIVAGVGIGLINPIKGAHHLKQDVVPVDLCANAIIALGWSTAVENKTSGISVYNFTSGELNPCTWGDFAYWLAVYFNQCPLKTNTGCPAVIATRNSFLHNLLDYEARLRFIFIDLMLRFSGKKPKLVNLHKKALKGAEVLAYFTSNQWDFAAENLDALFNSISSEDRVNFNFDIKSVRWAEYLVHYCQGTKQYALKENFEGLESCRRSMKRLEMIRTGSRMVMISFIFALVWKFVKREWFQLMSSHLLRGLRKLNIKAA